MYQEWLANTLDVVGVIGDGLAIAGALTGNPVLAGAGVALSVGSTAMSFALNISQRNFAGASGDAVGFGAGLIPGGGMVRRIGGAAADAGRNSAGRFVRNWRGRQAAQDIATQGMQERAVSSSIYSLGTLGCP